MEDLIIRQTTNGKELYNLRVTKCESFFKLWISQRKPLVLDNQTLVLQLGINSFKELSKIYNSNNLNKQDRKAVEEAYKYSNVY